MLLDLMRAGKKQKDKDFYRTKDLHKPLWPKVDSVTNRRVTLSHITL